MTLQSVLSLLLRYLYASDIILLLVVSLAVFPGWTPSAFQTGIHMSDMLPVVDNSYAALQPCTVLFLAVAYASAA